MTDTQIPAPQLLKASSVLSAVGGAQIPFAALLLYFGRIDRTWVVGQHLSAGLVVLAVTALTGTAYFVFKRMARCLRSGVRWGRGAGLCLAVVQSFLVFPAGLILGLSVFWALLLTWKDPQA